MVASLRCVAFAYRPCEMSDVPNEDQRAEWVLPEDNLIMLGIVGIKVNRKHAFYAFNHCCDGLLYYLIDSRAFFS